MGPRAKRAMTAMALTFGVVVAWTTEACRDATQMELDITYGGSCSDLHAVGLIVGTDPYAAESRIDGDIYTTTTSSCTQLTPTSAKVGTLVVTPNGDTDRASIVVLAGIGKPVESCSAKDGYFGCIVARRAFTFVPHTGLTLEISLDPDCLNVPCSAVSTCSHKQCVDSTVECTGSGCNPVGVLDDGGIATVDAPTSSDAFVQQEMDGSGPTDAGAKDAPADSPAEVGVDSSACQGMNAAVGCSAGVVPKTCSVMMGQACCYGFSSGLDGGGPDSGYDCRAAVSCSPSMMDPTINCRGTANCSNGNICCWQGFQGSPTLCQASCSFGMDSGAQRQICENGCECDSGKCGLPFNFDTNGTQKQLKVCF